MSFNSLRRSSVMACLLCATAATQAAVVPFTEDFATDNANWKDAAGADLTFVAVGGPDGSSYASGIASFAASNENDPLTLVRGQDNFNSSGDAFVGDWISQGVTNFSVWVRHNAPMPLPMFTRFATSFNFPGAAGVEFAPVLPNTWTLLSFDITPVNPQIVYEGPASTFQSVFGSIGNLQVGVQVPAGMAGFTPPVTIDIDQPSIVPEPASLALLALAGIGALNRRR